MRNTKTEYVSCPSCGRTLFDLQEVTDQIRTKTGHLPGVSIAVMGGPPPPPPFFEPSRRFHSRFVLQRAQ